MSLSPRIAENPLFEGLPPVERAKLLAELEERRYSAGEVIFDAGDFGDVLYLLVEGVVERRAGPGDDAILGTLHAPDFFGEQALFTGDPRTATIVAASDVLVALLPKPRFDALLERNPGLALHFLRVLSRRLTVTTRVVSEMHHGFEEMAAARLAAASPQERVFLTRTAILRDLQPSTVDALLGTDNAAERLAELLREGVVSPTEDGARYAYHPQLAAAMRDQLRSEIGEAGLLDLHARAAELLESHGDWAEAASQYVAARQPREAERVLIDAGHALLEKASAADGDSIADNAGQHQATAKLKIWLDASQAEGVPITAPLLSLQQAVYRRLGDRSGERRVLDAAISGSATDLDRETLAACYRRLSELAVDSGDHVGEARYLGLALALERDSATPETSEPPPSQASARTDGHVSGGRLALATDRAFRLAAAPAGGLRGARRRQVVGASLAVLLGTAFLLLPPPSDLSPAGWTTLGLLAVFIPILVLEVVPDYVAALLLVAAWAVLGVVPPRVALSGYASGTWILVLAVLGLGAAVTRTGLLYRAALLALTRLPPTHAAQGTALAALGILFTPAMPNATARTAMAAPLVAEIADALGYAPKSLPRAGLAVAALFGFGQTAGLFLTGSSTALLIHGVLPPEVRSQFSWGNWALAALPLHAVILLVGLAVGLRLFRPRIANPVALDRLQLQQRVLGPPSRAERITLATFLLMLAGFVGQPLHGVDPAWVGVAGLCLLLISGALDQATFRGGTNWSFLLYLGVLLGLGEVFVQLQLDAWLAGRLAVVLGPLAGSSIVFTLALTIASFALSFLVRWQAAGVLLTLVLAPVATVLGINPWVVGMIALVATNTFFLPYQSTIYLALYYGAGESFDHAQIRPVAWAYAGAVLLGVAVSVPYWRALGLLP